MVTQASVEEKLISATCVRGAGCLGNSGTGFSLLVARASCAWIHGRDARATVQTEPVLKFAMKEPEHMTARRLVLDCWERLNRPPVGARLLRNIQAHVAKQRGSDGALSPAAIARMLADEGAELRHPEIIERDVAWRQSMLREKAKEFAQAERLLSGEPLSLNAAEELIRNFDALRQKFEHEEAETALADELKALAVQARKVAQSIADHRSADEQLRATQSEIAEWLKVWLQTPALFNDWLELRKRSDEFRKKFS